jgi:hypothetical protein
MAFLPAMTTGLQSACLGQAIRTVADTVLALYCIKSLRPPRHMVSFLQWLHNMQLLLSSAI